MNYKRDRRGKRESNEISRFSYKVLTVLGVLVWVMAFMAISALNLYGVKGAASIEPNSAEIDIELLSYNPAPATPGEKIDVWLRINNNGLVEAKNFAIELLSNSVFRPYNNKTFKELGEIRPGESRVIKYELFVSGSAPKGINEMMVRYTTDYTKGYEHAIWVEEGIDIDIETYASALSTLIENEKDEVRPGEEGSVCITLFNQGTELIRDISITMSTDSTTIKPLETIRKTIPSILPSTKVKKCFSFMVDPETTPGVYLLPFSIAYYNTQGELNTFTEYSSIIVNEEPSYIVSFEQSREDNYQRILVGINNNGLSPLKYLSMEIKSVEGGKLVSPLTPVYIGTIDSDDEGSEEIYVIPQKDKVVISLQLEYLDSLNQKHVDDVKLEIPIEKDKSSKKGYILIVVVIVIIALIIIYKKKKR